jgi:hypothetical protein
LGDRGTVVSIIDGEACCSMTMVEGILGLELGSSIIWIIFWADRVDSWVQVSTVDIGCGLMNLARMIVGDTPVLGFLVRTSCMNVTDKILLMVLPKNMGSFGSLGNPGKGIFILYNWCSSSSYDYEVIGNL